VVSSARGGRRRYDGRVTRARTLPPTAPEAPSLGGGGGLHLVVFDPAGLRAQRLSPSRPIVVGRAPECDVEIDRAALSRRHFSVQAGAPSIVRDLGSANGTRVNGVLVASDAAVPIGVGEPIQAGGVFFVVQDHDPRDTQTPPARSAPARARRTDDAPGVIVRDAGMRELHELVKLVARSRLSVLVVGETGAGKEVIAELLHRSSGRAGPFVKLNCAALPDSLLESELFGYEKGAFSGAVGAKPGLIERAHGGTLFLDEIGEMSLATQPKLLRVLESGEMTRLGSVTPRVVDLRIVAATNRVLSACVAEGTFRQDLYFRLNGMTIPVRPLRERASEIPALAVHLLELAARQGGARAPEVAPDAVAVLTRHAWPGNVRELRTVMERAMVLSRGEAVRREHILIDAPSVSTAAGAAAPAARGGGGGDGRLVRVDPAEERRLIVEALERHAGNQTRAAEALGIARRTLLHRMDAYGIPRPRKRSSGDT
jgi:transcriptional regulator with PAS, ATPase and Fis domain